MKTYLLSKEHVQAYLLDYWNRVKELAKKDGVSLNDLRWVMLGESGRVLLQTLQETIGQQVGNPELYVIAKYHRDEKSVGLWTCQEIKMLDEASKTGETNKNSNIIREHVREALQGKKVIVVDSSVHSGKSMLALVQKVQEYAPASITSYSLVLKRNSNFIPNHFGLLIHDWDRALFLLDALPNNRMIFDGVFCKITDDTRCSIDFPRWLSTSSQSGWGQYIGQENVQTVVFVGNDRSVHSLINFEIIKDKTSGKYTCQVRKLAFDPTFRHKTLGDDNDHRIGSSLLRWAFTYARHCCCSKITLSCKT